MLQYYPSHVVLTCIPGALVHRLFLTPDHVLEPAIRVYSLSKLAFRERIQLLETNDRHVAQPPFTAPFDEIVIDLATADDKSINAARIDGFDLGQHVVKMTVAERDMQLSGESYHIDATTPRRDPFEGHFFHEEVKVSKARFGMILSFVG